jgi:hypothetical protein
VILLPVFGLVAGFVIGRRDAVIVTAAAAAIGFTLVAILTDEISGWVGRIRLGGHDRGAARDAARNPGTKVVPLAKATGLTTLSSNS